MDFYRIPVRCFIAARSVPAQEAYAKLLESDIYIGFAAEGTPFRAEWNIALSLKIPAFGYVHGPADAKAEPMPRYVANEGQLMVALASDLYHYSNRGLMQGKQTSRRQMVAETPALLCIILRSLNRSDYRKICGTKLPAEIQRMETCLKTLADQSPSNIDLILDRMERVFPGVFEGAEGVGDESDFHYYAEFDAPRRTPTAPVQTTGATEPPGPKAAASAAAEPEIPGEAGKIIKWFLYAWQLKRVRALALLTAVIVIGFGFWFVNRFGEKIATSVYESYKEKNAPKMYPPGGPWTPNTKAGNAESWIVSKGTWTNDQNSNLIVPDNSFGLANLSGDVLGSYTAEFGVLLDPKQRSVVWIPRARDKDYYFVVRLRFAEDGTKKCQVEGCLIQNGRTLGCQSGEKDRLIYEPIQEGDQLVVNMDVQGQLVTNTISLNRKKALSLRVEDMSRGEHTVDFTIPDTGLVVGHFGFEMKDGGKGESVYGISLTAKK